MFFHTTRRASESSALDTMGILILDRIHSLPEDANSYFDDFILGNTPPLNLPLTHMLNLRRFGKNSGTASGRIDQILQPVNIYKPPHMTPEERSERIQERQRRDSELIHRADNQDKTLTEELGRVETLPHRDTTNSTK